MFYGYFRRIGRTLSSNWIYLVVVGVSRPGWKTKDGCLPVRKDSRTQSRLFERLTNSGWISAEINSRGPLLAAPSFLRTHHTHIAYKHLSRCFLSPLHYYTYMNTTFVTQQRSSVCLKRPVRPSGRLAGFNRDTAKRGREREICRRVVHLYVRLNALAR